MGKRVLLVCLGNICRSPMADGLLSNKTQDLGWTVDSAGTSAFHAGEAPDPRMQRTARRHHVDLSQLKARQVEVSDFENFDLLFAMDKSNYQNLLNLAPSEEAKKKVKLILDEIYPGEGLEVPDPYFGGDHGFEQVYDLLDRATDAIVKHYHEG